MRRLAARLRREGPAVVLAGFAISLVFNWQVVLHPRSVVLNGLGDPLLQAWTMAWDSKFFSGGDFWTSNIFYPATDNFAFTDSLLGYLPLSLIGDGQYDAVLRYNIAYVFAYALAFIGAYALARQLGSNWQGAALAGVVFAWAPWRLDHSGHLNILSSGGIALALFALARGHGYTFRRDGERVLRPGWVLAGWLIATWQVTIGYAVGLSFIYVMGVIGVLVAVVSLVRRKEFGRRMHLANSVGMVVFLVVTLLITLPYLRVVGEYEFARQWTEVAHYSPNGWGLVTGSNQTWLWRGTFFNDLGRLPGGAGEKALFPGLVVLLAGLAGVVLSVWRKPVRIGLAVATVLVAVLSLGAGFFGGDFTYRLLWSTLPGWDALRTPGRLILWALLLLGLLAAGAVTALGRKLATWRPRIAGLVLLLPALGALLEGVPAHIVGHVPGIPPDLRAVFRETREPMLVLPIGQLPDYRYQLWSTEGFPLIANGNSSNFPPAYRQIAATVGTFPDNYSLAVLERWGIRKVVVLRTGLDAERVAGALTKDVSKLPVTRTEMTDLVVFTLNY